MIDGYSMTRRRAAALTQVNAPRRADLQDASAPALEENAGDLDGHREHQHHQPGARIRRGEHQHDAEDEENAGDYAPHGSVHT